MNFVQCITTPRDNIGYHDYLKPLITTPMKGGVTTAELRAYRLKKEAEDAERIERQKKAYQIMVKILGFMLALLYLPLKPWIWMIKSSVKNFRKLHSGTIVPL